ncbi:MAG TPA: pirin-like C-terminal cupin domain-containing protein, partial [Nitrospira sp.]|nr:pirin-like C-terminal cupin domain-containing protein [Nitrospira sp.]
RISVNGSAAAGEAELIVSKGQGPLVRLEVSDDSRLLIMSGKPINEPIARYGPFVMNTKAELVKAVEDYQGGRMGHLS